MSETKQIKPPKPSKSVNGGVAKKKVVPVEVTKICNKCGSLVANPEVLASRWSPETNSVEVIVCSKCP